MYLFNTGDLMELSKHSNINGFTMAEVLITLGILGVVIAMTLPSLIGKWQKIETVTRLKRAYTVLSQAVNYSIAEYEDVSGWDIYYYNMDNTNYETLIKNFISVYIVPFLPQIKKNEFTTFRGAGYKSIKCRDGSNPNWATLDSKGQVILLNDGSLIMVKLDSHNYGTADNPNSKLTNILFFIDINGTRNPNIVGRDIFLMLLRTDKASKLEFYNYLSYKYEDYLKRCQEGAGESRMCGMLIMMDGWQIKKHYPW